MVTSSDPLVVRQWHFKLLGDINTIWNEYSGAGVTVGVYDDGLQYDHPDLEGNYDPSRHFTYEGITYDPYPINLAPGDDADGHGTSVAGIIAGEAGNGLGGVGVAWGATLTGVTNLAGPIYADFDLELAACRHAQSLDIMSNSWAYRYLFNGDQNFFTDYLNRGDSSSTAGRTVAAMENAVINGRGGLGTVIVNAAGNDAANANGEGVNGSRFITDVAALTSTGQITSYSNYGTNILVSAGAASVTTDLLGSNGYNTVSGSSGNHVTDFSGTSAATPVVSGVVALMLDANEDLGWRDVREILATSASLTGAAVTGITKDETSSNVSQASGTWNGGGHAFSNDYGFGRVNAYAAVRMAEVWDLWSDEPLTSENEVSLEVAGRPGEVLQVPLATLAVNVNESISIEHIDVTMTFSFVGSSQRDYFDLFLRAPDGTEFKLLSDFDFERVNGDVYVPEFHWTYGVAHALGLNSAGNWSLYGTWGIPGATNAMVSDLSLTFYGREIDVDDVHHITSDFLRMSGTNRTLSSGRDRIIGDAGWSGQDPGGGHAMGDDRRRGADREYRYR